MGKPRASKKGRKVVEKSGAVMMEEEIWKDFPEDLFEAVLARVPIATFFRFRSVCRKWNSVLSCESFSEQCAQVKHVQPWFYTINIENLHTGAIYDPSSSKWLHPTVATLPTKQALYPVASAGGLICFSDNEHRSFYVCNPLTRSFRELPMPARSATAKELYGHTAVGMMTQINGGYKILCVGDEGCYQVFDSSANNNSWILPSGGRMPPSIKLPLGLKYITSLAVSVEGRYYFMRSHPYGLLSYDVDTGMWRQYDMPIPHKMIGNCHAVVESGGRIMLVGPLTEDEATRVCVWELQEKEEVWREVDRMPDAWCLEFYGRPVFMICVGNKDLIMLSIKLKQMKRLYSYHLSTREWLKLPGCVVPHTPTRRTQFIFHGAAFHPCLTAIP